MNRSVSGCAPAAEGLNKRAIYTMHSVWPRNEKTQEYLLDPKSVSDFRLRCV